MPRDFLYNNKVLVPRRKFLFGWWMRFLFGEYYPIVDEEDGIILKPGYTTEEQIEEMRKAILLEREKLSGRGLKSQDKKRQLMKTGGQVLFSIVVLILVVTIISTNIARSNGEIPDILGFNLFRVESSSMEPTLNIGAVIICRKTKEPSKLKVNDIVTFKNLSGYIVTHRIIEITTDSNGNTAYRTKGDNPRNSVDPELLTPDRVLSVFVAKIPLT